MSDILYPLIGLSRLRMETDGSGVTTLVAGAGCPLACRWCINKNELRDIAPENITPEELFARTRIDDLYFQATGGGLCFGGGEALLHTAFIAAFRELVGGAWKLTAETSLNVPRKNVEQALACVDEFIVDIKTADPAIYRSYTGGDNGIVFENLGLLLSSAGAERVKVRVPLIPEYNDEADREKTAGMLRSMGFTRIDLFEYSKRE